MAAGQREAASLLRNWELLAVHAAQHEFRSRWKRFLDAGGDLDEVSEVGPAAKVLERLELEEKTRMQEYVPHLTVVSEEVPAEVMASLATVVGPLAEAPPPPPKPRKFVALPVRVVALTEEQLHARLEHAEAKARVRRKLARADQWRRVAHGLPDALGKQALARTMITGGSGGGASPTSGRASPPGAREAAGDGGGGGVARNSSAAPMSELAQRRRLAARLIANDTRAMRCQVAIDGIEFVKTPALRSAVLRPSRARVEPVVRPAPDAKREVVHASEAAAAESRVRVAVAAADAAAARVGVDTGPPKPLSMRLPKTIAAVAAGAGAGERKHLRRKEPLEDPWAFG